MKLATPMAVALLLVPPLLLWGCAEPRNARGYASLPDSPGGAGTVVPPPNNAAYGAYPGPVEPQPLRNSAPPPPPPPATFDADRAVASTINQLFNTDQFLAPVSKNVTARVHKGVVTLRGTVNSEHARDEIVSRISQLPGVDRVDDQLRLQEGL